MIRKPGNFLMYYFDEIGPDYRPAFDYVNERILKSTGFELIVTKSFNERHYAILRLKSSYNGDYNGLVNFDSRFAVFNMTGMFGIKNTTTWSTVSVSTLPRVFAIPSPCLSFCTIVTLIIAGALKQYYRRWPYCDIIFRPGPSFWEAFDTTAEVTPYACRGKWKRQVLP